MITVRVPSQELWDELREEFVYVPPTDIPIEHSLASVSKWEAKWHKPFLDDVPKTNEEMIDYVRCMSLDASIPSDIYFYLTPDNMKQISDYLSKSMTATWFAQNKKKKNSKDVITSEIIYYWMIKQSIPLECQYWHLNRLLTLIRVCNEKNEEEAQNAQNGGKKGNMSRKEILAENAALNRARRKALGTKG